MMKISEDKIDSSQIWKKIRKKMPPPEKIHQTKKIYNRRRDKKDWERRIRQYY